MVLSLLRSAFQLFVLNPNVITSLIELPSLNLPGGGVTAGLSTSDKQVRVLLRDLSGKTSWDASILYRTPNLQPNDFINKTDAIDDSVDISNKWGPMSMIQPESFIIGNHSHLPQRAMRHRNPNTLPDITNAAPDLDQLDDVMHARFCIFRNVLLLFYIIVTTISRLHES